MSIEMLDDQMKHPRDKVHLELAEAELMIVQNYSYIASRSVIFIHGCTSRVHCLPVVIIRFAEPIKSVPLKPSLKQLMLLPFFSDVTKIESCEV